mgnify:CR=1 FL=1
MQEFFFQAIPSNFMATEKVMIYLDSAASTPLHECVKYEVLNGNSGSRTHRIGLGLKKQVEEAREHCAELLAIKPEQLIFTSGATESLMILIQGLKRAGYANWAISQTEHKAALNQVLDVDAHPQILDVDESGIVRIETLEPGCVGVAMSVNNETGVVNSPWGQMKNKGASLTIADCTQSIGKTDLHMEDECIDFMVGSAHKFHGPTGCGFIAARDADLWDLIQSPSMGGGQERGIRSGTLNSNSIIQTGQVAKWLQSNQSDYRAKLTSLKQSFEKGIMKKISAQIIGETASRAPHITSLYIPDVDNEAIIAAVNEKLAISSGSACTSHSIEPSHVILAMTNDIDIAESTIRVSFGWHNTQHEVEEAIELIADATNQIRSFLS